MKQTRKIKLTDKHLQVLEGLAQQGYISRSQLTIGVLRHVDQPKRRRLMNELRRANLVEEFTQKPARGATAHYYRLTEAGRKACAPPTA